MEKVTLAARTYWCAEKTLTIPEIPAFAEATLPAMFTHLQSAEVTPTGPVEFIYFNMDGDLARPFRMLLAIPIDGEGVPETDTFFPYRSTEISALKSSHQGSMATIGSAWDSLMQYAMMNRIQTTTECSEIYTQWVSPESADNVTELYVGIDASE